MNNSFDEKFMEINHFKIHKILLPFVGDSYNKYKILHIGESHYLNQNKNDKAVKYDIQYFLDNWKDNPCSEVLADSPNYVDTRAVVENKYLKGIKSRSYGIFTNMIKSFGKVMLNKEIRHIDDETRQLYNYFAFFNFFQMPALYSGEKYWNSLKISAKNLGNENLASEMWHQCAQFSVEVTDKVIDILEPNLIVFTSVSAAKAYKENNGKYANSDKLLIVAHPTSAWWNKKGYDRGKEFFEAKLSECKNKM